MFHHTLAILVCAFLQTQVIHVARASMQADGSRLSVSTERFHAVFRGTTMELLRAVRGPDFYLGAPSSLPEPDDREATDVIGPGLGTWRVHNGVATYTKEWEDGHLSMRIRVDGESGDLVTTATYTAEEPSVRSVAWRIEGLPLVRGDLILPSNGGVSIGEADLFREAQFNYPFGWPDWSSQLLIWQAKRGGFSVWSTDTRAEFKRLVVRRRGDLLDLELHTENPGPFTERTEAHSVEWRLNVHRGDWRVAAERYRTWMKEAFGLIPWNGEVDWAKDIRAIIGVPGRTFDPEFLPALQRAVIPERTLIYVPDWRKDGYDVNYPDYTPGEFINDFISEAHRRGFRVMLHVNLPGISPFHPLYEEFKPFHAKDPVSLTPLGWHWHEQLPVTHAFIDPAASKYRELYVSLMKRVIEETGADALHLDVSAPMWNDGNGLIEGMNYPRGSMALHRVLEEALPQVVFGGESINEVTLWGERFYQKWKLRGVGKPHPIESYLYGDFAFSVGYLGLPNPDESPGGYMAYARNYESWGVLPTIFCNTADASSLLRPRTRWLLSEARAWQENLLTPEFDRAWKKGEKFAWKSADGTKAFLEELDGGSVRMRIGEEVYYEHVRGTATWKSSLTIAGWPAFDGHRYLGLNPKQEYVALPIDREPLPIQILRLSKGSIIEAYRADSVSAVLALGRVPPRVSTSLGVQFLRGRAGTTIDGSDGPLQKGARFDLGPGFAERMEDVVFESVCPWHPEGDEQDKAWGEVFAETEWISLRRFSRPVLRFETALAASAMKGDGSTFRVAVNGKEVFSEWRRDTSLKQHTIPLGEYKGRIRIRFSLHPGPNNSVSYDLGLWRNPRIESVGDGPVSRRQKDRSVTIRTERPVLASSIEGKTQNGLVNFEGSFEDPLVLFFEPVTEVTQPVSLLEVPFEYGVEGLTVYTADQRAWGSGSIMSVTAGTETLRGISAHPPANGRTYIRQTVKVSKDLSSPRLRFTARLNEGAVTGGVGFLVVLNGRQLWSWSTRTPEYRDDSISLVDYVDQPLLIEWVTDSQGDANFDWAVWADPRIESGVNGQYPH